MPKGQSLTENVSQAPIDQSPPEPTAPRSADQEVHSPAVLAPIENMQHETTDTNELTISTPEDEEQIEPDEFILSVSGAEARLRNGFFGEHARITYIPEMNRWEDGITLYAFSVDYSNVQMDEVFDNYGFAYAWVNSLTQRTHFEESEKYHNVIDGRFPLPMLEGVVVPYNHFTPHFKYYEGAYWYYVETLTMESYESQLIESGFSLVGVDEYGVRIWHFVCREEDMTLIVNLSPNEGLFGITMWIYYGILD